MAPLLTLNAGKIHIGPDRVTINYCDAQSRPVSSNHMRIDDIGPDGQLLISVGEDKPDPMLGTKITVHADGVKGGYYFESQILEVRRLADRANMKVWVIAVPTKARKHYNRRAFRLDLSLPCRLHWRNDKQEEHSAAAVVIDLSFAGCRVVAKLDGRHRFPASSFMEARQQWIDIPTPDDFVAYELNRRTEPNAEEIVRQFRDIPINEIRFNPTRTRRGQGDRILIIGIGFAETPLMSRLVQFLEREMLQKLNVRGD